VATNVREHVATLCEESRELVLEATMVLRRGGSTMTVLSSFVEGLAGLVIDLVVVIRDGSVRVATVQTPQH